MNSAKYCNKTIPEWSTCEMAFRLAVGDMPMGIPARKQKSCIATFKGKSLDGRNRINMVDLYQDTPLKQTAEYKCSLMRTDVDDTDELTEENREIIQQGIDDLIRGNFQQAYNNFIDVAASNESRFTTQMSKLHGAKISMPEPALTSELEQGVQQL